MKEQAKAINPAEIIIQDYISLSAIESNRESWSEEQLKGNEPRYYRFKRITSCFEALGYEKIDFSNLADSVRFSSLSAEQLKKILDTIENTFSVDHKQYLEEWSSFSPRFTFDFLIRILESIYSLTSQRNGVLEASGYHLIPVLMLENIEEKLSLEKQAIEKVLSLLLNPTEKTFSSVDLVTKYDFPLVDLEEIDLDWL